MAKIIKQNNFEKFKNLHDSITWTTEETTTFLELIINHCRANMAQLIQDDIRENDEIINSSDIFPIHPIVKLGIRKFY